MLKIGVDIIEVGRLRRRLAELPGLEQDLFAESELTRYRSTRHAHRHLAACLAVKEAFLKATGVGLHSGVVFKDIETVIDAAGTTGLRLRGRARTLVGGADAVECRVSCASTEQLACAVVVLPQEGRGSNESFRLLRGSEQRF